MGVSYPVFICIKNKCVDNDQRQVNKEPDLGQSYKNWWFESLLVSRFVCFKFLAERNLRLIWNFYIYMTINKPYKDFIRKSMLSLFNYNTMLGSLPTSEIYELILSKCCKEM